MFDDSENTDEPVPLPEISKLTLAKVIEYLKHIKDNREPEIEKPLRSSKLEDLIDKWYADFIKMDDDLVQDIIIAANFMEIKSLLDLACAQIASIIRTLTIPEFRKRFNIENDFTPEEENEPYDEARIAELAEEYERQTQAAKEGGAI